MPSMTPQNSQNLANMEAARNRNKELEAEARRRTKERQERELFPPERISGLWLELVTRALPETSPITQQVPIDDFAEVVAIDPMVTKITYFQYGILSNSLDAVSPTFLKLSREQYKAFVTTDVVPHVRHWNEKKLEWYAHYAREVADEERMKNALAATDKALEVLDKSKLAKA